MRPIIFAVLLLLSLVLQACSPQTTPTVSVSVTPVAVSTVTPTTPSVTVGALSITAFPAPEPMPSPMLTGNPLDVFGNDLLILPTDSGERVIGLNRYRRSTKTLVPIFDNAAITAKLQAAGATNLRLSRLWVNQAGTFAHALFAKAEIAIDGDVFLVSIDLNSNAVSEAKLLPHARPLGGAGPYPDAAAAFVISPSGDALAFLQPDKLEGQHGKGGIGLAKPAHNAGGVAGSIQIIDLNTPTLQATKLATCGTIENDTGIQACSGLSWSAQGNFIILLGAKGPMIVEPGKPLRALMLTEQGELLMPATIQYVLGNSPDEHSILVDISTSDSAAYAIVDVSSGRVARILKRANTRSNFIWLQDGRLVEHYVSYPQVTPKESGITIWKIDPNIARLEAQVDLALDPKLILDGWRQRSDGDLSMAVIDCGAIDSLDTICDYSLLIVDLKVGQIKANYTLPKVPMPHGYRAHTMDWLANSSIGFFQSLNSSSRALTAYWVFDTGLVDAVTLFAGSPINPENVLLVGIP